MRKTVLVFLCALFAAAGCSTIDQNLNARKNLEKCTFEVAALEFVKLNGKASRPESIDLNALLKVTNPNASDVALDHVDADILIDGKKAAAVSHKNFVRIKAKSSVTEKAAVNIPFSAEWVTGKRPETVTIDGEVYLNIMIGDYTLPAPTAVKIKKTVPIPWDRIAKALVSGGLKMLFR